MEKKVMHFDICHVHSNFHIYCDIGGCICLESYVVTILLSSACISKRYGVHVEFFKIGLTA